MVEGWVLIDEAVRSGVVVQSVYVTADERDALVARRVDGPAYEISRSAMESISVLETPPGALAVVDFPFPSPTDTESHLILLLFDISDPGNAGTLIRSAEAAGFDEVVLAGKSVDLSSPKVIRASAGSAFRMRCTRLADLDGLRRHGVTILGLTSVPSSVDRTPATTGSRPIESIYEVPLREPLAIAVGSEAHGLSPDLPVDRWVNIPHHGPAESLNAAMAGTVACMHVGHRLRGNDPSAPTSRG